MTNYQIPLTPHPSFPIQQAKQERRHLLEQIRKQRYQQEKGRHKHQQQEYQTSEEYRDYQTMLKEEAKLSR